MKKLLTIIFIFGAFNANAFYTTFESDMEALRKSVYDKNNDIKNKEKFLKKVRPAIKQARDNAYLRIASGCSSDLAKYCPKQNTLDSKIKCLSEHKFVLSNICKDVVKKNFRKQEL